MFLKTLLPGCMLAALLAGHVSRAQEEPPAAAEETNEPGIKWLQAHFMESAAKYDFFLDEARTEELELVDHAIFHWKQDDDWRGDLFIWERQGRPGVLGCILASNPNGASRTIFHEFHVLTETPIHPGKLQATRWAPASGAMRQTIAGAPTPADSAPLRLSQLRKLAREFVVTMQVDNHPWELRLLPQPIYRYSAPEAGVIDGALFTYVWTKGTDPEFILLVECLKEESGRRWVYAPVKMTNRSLSVVRNEDEVWTCPTDGQPSIDSPYASYYSETATVPGDQP